jgi:hypothetical protein
LPAPPLDAAELLDVDVDQLAGDLAFVTLRGLQTQPAEPAHPDLREDPRHRRHGPSENLGDLRPGEAQPSQRSDRLDRALVSAVGHDVRR